MKYDNARILDLLRQQTSRYIQDDMGYYIMKEANGADVVLEDNGQKYRVEPTEEQMGDLIRAWKVIREDHKYFLAVANY